MLLHVIACYCMLNLTTKFHEVAQSFLISEDMEKNNIEDIQFFYSYFLMTPE
jgi:hypothetical protein